MKKFGDIGGLNQKVAENIEKLIRQIEEKEIECTLFYGFPLIELDNTTTIMKCCIISQKGIIVLCDSSDEKKTYWRHLLKIIMECPSLSELAMDPSHHLITSYESNDSKAIVESLCSAENMMSETDVNLLVAVIQKAYNLTKYDSRVISTTNSLGNVIRERNNSINTLDENQFNTIYKAQCGHARIRGLAGSGKTILLVKKMAYLHFRYPDIKIAYVFYTVSLKQYIEKLFLTYYKEFEQYNDPDMTKISILHSWGSKFVDGFYSTVCKQYGIERKTIKDVYNVRDKFSAVCNDLLEQIKSKDIGMYDYVFIDEAQDFSIGFFKLALRTLRPTGKLLYAYDELQTLNSDVKIPTKYNIFGKRQCEDINLSICYRTPKEILVTAHAIGLGVYRKKEDGSSGIVNMIQDISTWSAIGYEVSEGELSYGKDVVLSRNDVITTKCSNCIVVDEKSTEIEQYEFVTKEILNMLENEDVKSDDILIIDLDSININDNFARFKDVFTSLMWNNTTKKWKSAVNLVNKDNAIKFRISNSIPYTTIFRAKGNEANIVFVINSHKMQSISSYSRNRIFTAILVLEICKHLSKNQMLFMQMIINYASNIQPKTN